MSAPAAHEAGGRRSPRMRAARFAVAAALTAFWALVLLGGVLEPGYSQVQDYVSRLASYGARYPAVGIAAISMLATAHLAGAEVLRRAGARVAAVALAGAAASGYVVAAFRITCPGGAAGCRGAAGAAGLTDRVHAIGVVAYEAFLVIAVVAAAGWAVRRLHRPGLAALWLGLGLASLVAAARVGAPDAGADQRLWLGVSTVWLLTLLGLAECRHERAPARRP